MELLQIQNPASLLDPLHPTFLDHGTLLPGPSFRLQWAGGQGNISLETSTDLNVWKELTTQPASLDPVTFTHPTGDPAQARFYRLVARP